MQGNANDKRPFHGGNGELEVTDKTIQQQQQQQQQKAPGHHGGGGGGAVEDNNRVDATVTTDGDDDEEEQSECQPKAPKRSRSDNTTITATSLPPTAASGGSIAYAQEQLCDVQEQQQQQQQQQSSSTDVNAASGVIVQQEEDNLQQQQQEGQQQHQRQHPDPGMGVGVGGMGTLQDLFLRHQAAAVATTSPATPFFGIPNVAGPAGVVSLNYPGLFFNSPLPGNSMAPGSSSTADPLAAAQAAALQQRLWAAGVAGFPSAVSGNPIFSQALGLNIRAGTGNNSADVAGPSNQGRAGEALGSVHTASHQGPNNFVTDATSAVVGGAVAPPPHQQQHHDETVATSSSSGATSAVPSQEEGGLSGRPAILLYMTCDDDSLSEYQCLVRKQIEIFEACREDVESNAQGRNRPIVMGQVGIRCKHCTMLPPKHRARGAVYYPARLQGLYQAAQNMASSHLCDHCQHVPDKTREELIRLRDRKSSAGGGKNYWADGVRVVGVYEDTDGLRFKKG